MGEQIKKNNWKITSEIVIDMGSNENAEIFLNSFTPELETLPKQRSSLDIKKTDNNISFDIKATDLTAFRATINSVLQFGTVVENIISYVEKKPKEINE